MEGDIYLIYDKDGYCWNGTGWVKITGGHSVTTSGDNYTPSYFYDNINNDNTHTNKNNNRR